MMKIPFLSLKHQTELVKYDVLQSIEDIINKDWYINGEELKKFELKFKEFNQSKYCVGVGNGLDALRLALIALDIKKGHEVIVPANTFIATWLAVAQVGAKIVPVEPNIETYNIDVELIEKSINSATRAIIPVHLYGQACQMDKIVELANKYSLHIIEDNAQAQGAKFKDQLTGSFGIVNATSFYPGKNLGAMGDAGAITTNSAELNNELKQLRNYGSSEKYIHDCLGYNSRLDEIQAAILSHKLSHLRSWNQQRIELADLYHRILYDVEQITLPQLAKNTNHVYHLFVIRTAKRNKLRDYLLKNGVETLVHYPVPPHLQKAFSHLGYKKGSFPITEKLSEELISLPLYPGLSKEQVNYISKIIRDFFEK